MINNEEHVALYVSPNIIKMKHITKEMEFKKGLEEIKGEKLRD
ncbi:hypothetical protein bthur0011_59310 [Bacillus thuringiensis serovar huazhongensis BGSC 4BD1]|nr:hypothetical protein bthur0011_59310 [Bacillus thuringiensis serovar huazhongensis BGSC 4BD1]